MLGKSRCYRPVRNAHDQKGGPALATDVWLARYRLQEGGAGARGLFVGDYVGLAVAGDTFTPSSRPVSVEPALATGTRVGASPR
jgi:hypothetical protein